MAEAATKRFAVVTGANKGIGFEICRQLASHGIMVILTARDEKRGLDALQKLKQSDFSDYFLFHKLDVADPASISAVADFVKAQFGKLDILVNNAGVGGVKVDTEAYKESIKEGPITNWFKITTQTYELAEECLTINYYGAKRMVEAFVPLLQLSDSPRIVNVSSSMGKLKNVKNEWAKQVLDDAENLSEEKIDEVLTKYLNDFKEGSLEKNNWPALMSAYILSKAAMNAYTRILGKKLLSFRVNSVCPGFVKTDINLNTGILTVEEGAECPVRLALLPNDGPSGCFFDRNDPSPF